jgi:hypothetical protein
VPTPDDERFETYLKQFRPLLPDALPTSTPERSLGGNWVFGIWSAGAAAVIILGVIGFRAIFPTSKPENPPPTTVNSPIQPLTMRDANSLLASAPSYKSALDEMAFHPEHSIVPKDQQSAVAVLSKEKIKL